MIPFINKLMTSVRNFGIMDFAIFKLFMVSAGIILGTYFLYRIHACRRG